MRAFVLTLVSMLGAASLVPAAARPAASRWSDHKVVRARLVAAPLAAGSGGELRLGLQLRLAPGWHVYWRHPGDAGMPPEVVLTGEPKVGGGRLLFPAPRRFALAGGLIALGYEGEVLYPLRARTVDPAARPRRLTAAVDYVACASECIPFHDELAIDLGAPGGAADAALLTAWERRLPRPVTTVPGLSVAASYRPASGGGEVMIELGGAAASTDTARHAELFLEPPVELECGVPRRERLPGGVRFRTACRVVEALPATLRLPWTVTGLGTAAAPLAVEGVAALSTRRH